MKNFLRALRHAMPYRRRLVLSIICAFCAAAFWGGNFSSIYPVLTLLQYKQSPHEWINKTIAKYQKEVLEYQHLIEQKNVELEERKKEQEQRTPSPLLDQRIDEMEKEVLHLQHQMELKSAELEGRKKEQEQKKEPSPLLEQHIGDLEKEVLDFQHRLELKNIELEGRRKEQEQRKGPSPFIEQRIRDINRDLSKLEAKLSPARRSLYWSQVARKYIYRFPSLDCFVALAWVIVLVVVGIIIKCFFEFVQESLVGSVVNLSLFDLRNRFYRNAIHLDVDQFGEQGTSELMARFTNDMESLGAGIKVLFGKVVAEPLKALACVILACLISWQLTLMFLILVPIAVFILARVGRIMKQATRRLLERMSNIYKILQESFQGIRVVKAFTMEPHERRRFRIATLDYYRKAMLVVNIDALADPIIEILAVAAVAGALLAGSHLVLHQATHLFGMRMTEHPLEAAELLQLYIYLAAIADPVRKLSSVFTRIQSACAAADRIFDFVDRRPRVKANSDGPRLRRLPVSPPVSSAPGLYPSYIEFRDVCF